jgi:uncharacterized repeat protein (TIGR01451 family)
VPASAGTDGRPLHRRSPPSDRGGGRIASAVASARWTVLGGLACVVAVLALGTGTAAAAGTASVTISPSTATTPSGVAVTYTLTVTCGVTGGCEGTSVSFPSTTISGDGATTDFASMVGNSSCPGVTKTTGGGKVTFTYGKVETGTKQCEFSVKSPEYTTLNGAQITITPTIEGSNFTSASGSPAVLTVTAGHNDSLTKFGPNRAVSGLNYSYELTFYCGKEAKYTGDVGLSSLTITDQLPAGFTYESSSTRNTPMPGSLTYEPGTRTLKYSDPTGASCGNPPLNFSNAIVITVNGKASNEGVADPVGSTVCNKASSSFTYIDGTEATSNSAETCAQVIELVTAVEKTSSATTLGNLGQYKFEGKTYPYTFPGNWDGSGLSAFYDIQLKASTTNAGVEFAVEDPLPCLTNLSGGIYSSDPAPGAPYCAEPAFIPTLVQAFGFTPTAGDEITLVHTDGTTTKVPYTAGGWHIPTSPAVAEIDMPRFAEEANNFGNPFSFRVRGYAAASTSTTSLLKNTVTAAPYLVGSAAPLHSAETSSASIMVVSAAEPSGTVVYPNLSSFKGAAPCTENVELNNFANGVLSNYVEIASAPSQAIYLDYLAPAGATGIEGQNEKFSLNGQANGKSFTTPTAITPTQSPNFGGTGRTLYEWAIPAGTVTIPGLYLLVPEHRSLTVSLAPGCAGTYQNDMTLGYGAPITGCIYDNYFSAHEEAPPLYPLADGDLKSNGSPLANNYCGYSAPLKLAATNPGFSVDKTAQGNLDAKPVSSGGIGDVSPSGGTATYELTFANTGESNLTNPVIYDILPAIGDTEATSLTPRGSEFGVTLASIGALPAGVSVEYSKSSNPCRPEVLASDPGCVNDWSSTPPSPLSSVKALKFLYTGTVVVEGASGTHGFKVPFTVSTPTGVAGKVAWNSVGTNAYAGETLVGAAESSRTGLEGQVGPTIVKSSATASYAKSGDSISYTYTVTNNTQVTLSNVGVTDELQGAAPGDVAPAVTCQSRSTPAGSCSGATTTLQPGQSATFVSTYHATQPDVDAGSLADIATVSAKPPTGGALGNTSNTVTVPAVQSPGLSLEKTVNPTKVTAAGQSVTYAFLVKNTGNVDLSEVSVVETGFSGTGTPPVVSCPGTTLAPGAQMTCTAPYTVTQADMETGSVLNTAHAAGEAPGGSPVTSSPSSAVLTATPLADLSIEKTASNPELVPGSDQTYTLKVHNHGPSTAKNVKVVDPIPAETTFVSASAGCTEATGTVSCGLAELASGETVEFEVTVEISPTVGASVVNAAHVESETPDPEPENNESTVSTPEKADLEIEKTASPSPAIAGGDLTYTLKVHDNGPSNALHVKAVDHLPSQVTFVSASEGCAEAGGAVTCEMASIGAGRTHEFTIVIEVEAGATGEIANAAQVESETPDPEPANNEDEIHTPTGSQADLEIEKAAGPSTAVPDTEETYTLKVHNNGPSPAKAVEAFDHLPSQVSFVSASAGCAEVAGTVTCSLAELASGGTHEFTIVTEVKASAEGEIANAAQVESETPDPEPANNEDEVHTPTAPQADLEIEKTASPSLAVPGEQLTYTLKVHDNGPSTAREVEAFDQLPSRVSFVSASAGCTEAAGTVTCALAELASGGTHEFTIVTEVAPGSTGEIINAAHVESGTTDPEPGNNEAEIHTPTTPRADLEIKKTASDPELVPGSEQTYTLKVHDKGPSAAKNVKVTDPIPAGTTFIAASGACEENAGTVTCALAEIEAGETVEFEVTVEISPTIEHPVVNSAKVESETPDPEPANNESSVTTPEEADLGIEKTASPSPAVAGENLTYTLRVFNNGPSNALHVVATDHLPAGTSFVSASEGCGETGGTVTCTMASLLAGADHSFTLVVHVDASVTGELANGAHVESETPDHDPANNQDEIHTPVNQPGKPTATTTPPPPSAEPIHHKKPKHAPQPKPDKPNLVISKTASADFARPSAVVGYTITVRNKGDGDAHGVMVCDEPPAGLAILRTDPAVSGKAGTCWVLKVLAAGTKRVFRVTAQLGTALRGTVERNRATVSAANVKGMRTASAGVRVKPLPNTACGSSLARPVFGPPRIALRC